MLTESRDHATTIRSLLSLANRPGTAAEGKTARDQANRLADKHGINIKELETEFEVKKAPVPQTTPVVTPDVDTFALALKRHGWRKEYKPIQNGTSSYIHPSNPGHRIESDQGKWQHSVYGNVRYAGNGEDALRKHLAFVVQ